VARKEVIYGLHMLLQSYLETRRIKETEKSGPLPMRKRNGWNFSERLYRSTEPSVAMYPSGAGGNLLVPTEIYEVAKPTSQGFNLGSITLL